MTRPVQFVAGVALAGVFVWLILRDLDRAAVADAFRDPDWNWLGLGLAFWVAGYSVRVMRSQAMLAVANPGLGFWRCAVPFLGSIAANNVMPLRLGDVLRCVAFGRWLGVDAGTVTATVLTERLLDLLTLLLAVGLAVLAFAPRSGVSGLLDVGASVLVALAALALGLLLVPGALRPLAERTEGLVRRASPSAADRIAGFSRPMIDTLAILSGRRRLPGLVAASLLVWTLEGAVFWAVAMAIPAMAAPVAAWLAMPVGTLATLLPSTPGHIGTFDYFAIRAAEAGGNSTAAATAFAVLVHACFYILATIAGGVSLLVWRMQRDRT